MVKKLILYVMLLVFTFSLVSAIDTEIKIKTLPVHRVSIFVYPSGEITFVNSFHKDSDIYGNLEVVHSSSDEKLDIKVKVSKDGKKIFLEDFKDYKAGEPIYIRIDNEEITGNYVEPTKEEPPENETINETENESAVNESQNNILSESEVEKNEEPVTGSAISNKIPYSNSIPKYVYYIIAGVVIVLIIILLLYKRFSVNNLCALPKEETDSTITTSETGKPNQTEREVKLLTMQLIAAQREINRLKNENRIKEIQRKIDEEKKELERIRMGKEDS